MEFKFLDHYGAPPACALTIQVVALCPACPAWSQGAAAETTMGGTAGQVSALFQPEGILMWTGRWWVGLVGRWW